MERRFSDNKKSRRRGVVVVFVGASLVTLLLVGALAVDVGYVCALTAEAQTAADAGALAGAGALRKGEYDFVFTQTLQILNKNQQAQGFEADGDQIVEAGRWDITTKSFTKVGPTEVASVNAVRVVAIRKNVPLFFAAIAGHTTTTVSRQAIAQVSPSCNGIWGISSVKVPGTVDIDSFDSTEGAYSAPGDSDGDLCSNGTITVQGNATVDGDIRTTEVVLNGGAMNITGVIEEAANLATPPPVDFGDALTNNDNASIGLTDAGTDPLDNSAVSNPGFFDLILRNSENLTLAPGTYIFDDIDMSGSSTLTLTGPTTIYLDDDLEMEGTAVLNTSGNSADLTIICDGDSDGSKIKINGNSEFYGAIMAPNSEISLKGTADYYGAIIGNTVDFGGNFSFHLDESLELAQQMKDRVFLVQ